jgi:hypothetical protein
MTAQEWAGVFANQLTRAERFATEYAGLVDRVAANGWLTVGEHERQQELLAEFYSMFEAHRRLLAREG